MSSRAERGTVTRKRAARVSSACLCAREAVFSAGRIRGNRAQATTAPMFRSIRSTGARDRFSGGSPRGRVRRDGEGGGHNVKAELIDGRRLRGFEHVGHETLGWIGFHKKRDRTRSSATCRPPITRRFNKEVSARRSERRVGTFTWPKVGTLRWRLTPRHSKEPAAIRPRRQHPVEPVTRLSMSSVSW